MCHGKDLENSLVQFSKLNKIDQIIWLGKIIYTISMIGRGTYEAGTDAVLDPVKLRRLNELVHRISSLQVSIGVGTKDDLDSFIAGTLETLEQEVEYLKIPVSLFQLR